MVTWSNPVSSFWDTDQARGTALAHEDCDLAEDDGLPKGVLIFELVRMWVPWAKSYLIWGKKQQLYRFLVAESSCCNWGLLGECLCRTNILGTWTTWSQSNLCLKEVKRSKFHLGLHFRPSSSLESLSHPFYFIFASVSRVLWLIAIAKSLFIVLHVTIS